MNDKPSDSISLERSNIKKMVLNSSLNKNGIGNKDLDFLIPNKKSEKPLYTYVVSVDNIEELTGIDFFPKLDDELGNSLEKRTDYKSWILD